MLLYGASKYIISHDRQPGLWDYSHKNTTLSKNLKNAATFRIRQCFTARGKDKLTDNEQQVMDEIKATADATGRKRPKSVMSYGFLEKLMRVTHNPDFFAGLPMQSVQQILRNACNDFGSWIKAVKAYNKNPEAFTGKPKMPGYIRSDETVAIFTNQDCVVYRDDDGTAHLKFPLTKETLKLGAFPETVTLREVRIIPYYGSYEVILSYLYEAHEADQGSMPYMAAIDLGLDNTAAIVSNSGEAGCIYKGGAVKACNQWFNKRMSHLKSVQMKGHDPKAYHPAQTKAMLSLSRYRDCFMNDFFHKTASDIVKRLLKWHCGTLVVGVNKGQKQSSNMGHVNSQSFVGIPFFVFRRMLKYLCEREGILYIEREESYTSKASFVDSDYIPTFGKDDHMASFSGSRTKRGLYRTMDGTLVNADLNGAGNILRKEYPDAFSGIKDIKGLISSPVVVRFHDLYLKRDPVKRTVAA